MIKVTDPPLCHQMSPSSGDWLVISSALITLPPLVSVLSSSSAGAPSLLFRLFLYSATPLLWHNGPHPEKRPAESCRGPANTLDGSHDPEGTNYIFPPEIYPISQYKCSNKINSFITQALHLIGQALLEEKSQLEDVTAEEVTFDFSLKARCEWEKWALLSLWNRVITFWEVKSLFLFFSNGCRTWQVSVPLVVQD